MAFPAFVPQLPVVILLAETIARCAAAALHPLHIAIAGAASTRCPPSSSDAAAARRCSWWAPRTSRPLRWPSARWVRRFQPGQLHLFGSELRALHCHADTSRQLATVTRCCWCLQQGRPYSIASVCHTHLRTPPSCAGAARGQRRPSSPPASPKKAAAAGDGKPKAPAESGAQAAVRTAAEE